MTVGMPAKLILRFSLPLLAGNILQQLYNLADTVIVGRTLGANALAALGSTGNLFWLIIGFVSGMSIVTAQRFGAGDEVGVRKSYASMLISGLILSVGISVLGVLLIRPFLNLLRTPDVIFEDTALYITILVMGLGATMLFNLTSGVLRAMGDSRTPLAFLAAACLLNILLDLLFIVIWGMGVGGAAIATVIAQLFSGAGCLLYIYKKFPQLRVTSHDFANLPQEMRVHLKIGLPIGLQSSIISIGGFAVQYALNGLGPVYIASFAAGDKIDMFTLMQASSFGTAMATYTAQNYGAGRYDRIRAGIFQCMVISGGFSIFMGILNIAAGGVFASLILPQNAQAIQLTHTYLKIDSSAYILVALLFIFRNSLQGIGNTAAPVLGSLFELAMRAVAALVLGRRFGFWGICLSNPLAWLGACALMGGVLWLQLRRLKNRDYNSMQSHE